MKMPFLQNVALEVPEGWADFSVVTLVAPPQGAFRPNVVVTSEDLVDGVAVANHAKAQLKALKADAAAFKLITEGPATVGGHAGYMAEFSFKTPETQGLRQIQYYAALGARVYTLSLTHLDEDFEKQRPTFAEIASRFRLG